VGGLESAWGPARAICISCACGNYLTLQFAATIFGTFRPRTRAETGTKTCICGPARMVGASAGRAFYALGHGGEV
jgi:hypothetical protein